MKIKLSKIVNTLLIGTFIFSSIGLTSCESTSELIFSGNDYIEESISEDEDFLITEITYPKFLNIPELNKMIKNSVVSHWESFKTYAEDNWNKISGLNSSSYYPPFNYTVNYKVTYSEDIVSIYLSTYTFDGGAHGKTTIKTINYDKRAKKYLSIVEATGYSYEELSEKCRKSLYKQFISEDKMNLTQDTVDILDEMREEGTAPYAGNFQNFVLDGNKVIIYFEPYTVAPYNYGIPQVEFVKK